MTSDEAHNILRLSSLRIKDIRLRTAIDIALKALAWECVHEKTKKLYKEEQNEN